MIGDAQIFHISAGPDGVHWDGIEYCDPARSEGVVYGFRGSTPNGPQHTFVLAGLNPAQQFKLHFQYGSAPDRPATGRELMQGLDVKLAQPLSSALIFITPASHH